MSDNKTIMMTSAPETLNIQNQLRLIFGKPIDLRSPEIISLTPAGIKQAYRRMALECHPDRAASTGLSARYLTERFTAIQDAYAGLIDAVNSGRLAEILASPPPVQTNRRSEERTDFAARTDGKASSGNGPSSSYYGSFTRSAPKGDFGRARPAEGNFEARRAPKRESFFSGANLPEMELRFAQYLYYCDKIDRETVIRSLSWQYKNRPKIGDLGLEAGYLDHADIIAILRGKRMEERFGEAATRLGVLSTHNLSVLMGRQRQLDLPIGRYFLEKGFISDGEIERVLDSQFRHNFRVRLERAQRARAN